MGATTCFRYLLRAAPTPSAGESRYVTETSSVIPIAR